MLRWSFTLKTWIGRSFSMHSDSAVASITSQPALERLAVRDLGQEDSPRRLRARVGVVDAVDAVLAHQDRLGADLAGPQRRRGVGREERVAGAAGEDDDAALLEVADRAAPDVRLGDLLDVERRLHARVDAELLERVLDAPARSARSRACPRSRPWRGPCRSAAGRSPRKMLPPPTTIATSTPAGRARRGSARGRGADPVRVLAVGSSAIKPSPESLSRMRRKAGGRDGLAAPPAASGRPAVMLSAALEAGEALDLDVLLRLGGQAGAQLLDRVVAVADVRLVEQARRPRTTCRACPGRSGRARSRACPRPARGRCRARPHQVLRARRRGSPSASRASRRHLQGDLVGELAERLACSPRSRSRSRPRRARRCARCRGCRRRRRPRLVVRSARLAAFGDPRSRSELDRGVDVAAGARQGPLAVHHAGAGALAHGLDLLAAEGL